MATMSPIRLTAYEWHGGGGSPLYSFASTGGIVHSEEHRGNLIHEIEGNITWCEGNPETEESKDKSRLSVLLEHVRTAEVGVRIEDPAENYE